MLYIDNKKILIPKNIKSIKNLIKYINSQYKLLYQRDYILQDKLTNKFYYSNKFSGKEKIETLEIIFILSGGGKIADTIKNSLGKIFKPIIDPIVAIGSAFMLLLKILLWLIQFIIWLFRFIVWIFIVFIPALITDISGFVKLIIITIFDSTFGLAKNLIKKIFGDGISKDKTNDKNYKCYGVNDDGTIPTTILISTILCPPLGVFMMYGLSGWLKILISALLSLIYYLPGLIYSLVLFYR
jgi:uncharacterized membrane protein YqaE (UPF0057 family)